MIVFNTRYGFMRWAAYFALCFLEVKAEIQQVRRIAQIEKSRLCVYFS